MSLSTEAMKYGSVPVVLLDVFIDNRAFNQHGPKTAYSRHLSIFHCF